MNLLTNNYVDNSRYSSFTPTFNVITARVSLIKCSGSLYSRQKYFYHSKPNNTAAKAYVGDEKCHAL